jgi:hypothetical protein
MYNITVPLELYQWITKSISRNIRVSRQLSIIFVTQNIELKKYLYTRHLHFYEHSKSTYCFVNISIIILKKMSRSSP